MEIVYRPMHLSDVESAWKLFEAIKEEQCNMSFAEVPHKDTLTEWLKAEHIFLYIAESKDGIIAILKAVRGIEPSKRHAVFLSAATHPAYRSRGIARELTSAGLEDMKKDGVTLARAYIYSDNIPSIATILRLGFTCSGSVYQHHYSTAAQGYVDDLIFYKVL